MQAYLSVAFILIQQHIVEISAYTTLSSKDILFKSYYNNALTINRSFRIMKKIISIILKMEREGEGRIITYDRPFAGLFVSVFKKGVSR